jgi:hypothetical protein
MDKGRFPKLGHAIWGQLSTIEHQENTWSSYYFQDVRNHAVWGDMTVVL